MNDKLKFCCFFFLFSYSYTNEICGNLEEFIEMNETTEIVRWQHYSYFIVCIVLFDVLVVGTKIAITPISFSSQ